MVRGETETELKESKRFKTESIPDNHLDADPRVNEEQTIDPETLMSDLSKKQKEEGFIPPQMPE